MRDVQVISGQLLKGFLRLSRMLLPLILHKSGKDFPFFHFKIKSILTIGLLSYIYATVREESLQLVPARYFMSSLSMSLLIYCLFAQSLRYAEKKILGISIICLWLFFHNASTLNENPSKSTDSSLSRCTTS